MNLPSMTIDILIFIAFFLLNVVVGFRHRGGKRQSFKEYAIGDKKFSTATLTATIVATSMSGSILFFDLEETYSQGLYYIIAALVGGTSGLLLTGRVIGPRIGKFLNNVSVPDSLGKLYGKQVQAIAGIGAILSSIGYIAIQFKVIGRILTALFNYEGPEVIIIAATVIILYSFTGGVRAVTLTDVLQFFTFGTLLPVLALVIWNKMTDTTQVAHLLDTNPLFSWKEVLKWSPEFVGMLTLTFYFSTPALPPELFQRMVMARDVIQVKRSVTWAAIICLGIELCMIWIAILLLADAPGLESSRLVQHIAHTYAYPGLKGFLGIGVVALAMSTADSTLNSSSVIFSNDILSRYNTRQDVSLKIAKWATIGIGFFALLISLRFDGLLRILKTSASFYTPIVLIPMVLAIFGFQTSRRVVLMAMAAGFVTVFACVFFYRDIDGYSLGMLANLIVMLGAHYLLGEKGGWGHNPLRDKKKGKFLQLLQTGSENKIPRKRKFQLYRYLESTLPTEDYFYSLFGFYVFTATYASFYLLPHAITVQFATLYQAMQYSILLLFTTFLAFPIWPKIMKEKHFLVWMWPLSAFYTLFLVGSVLVVLSGFADTQLLIFMLNFIMAVLLLHWPIAIAMTIGGWLLIIVVFNQYTNLTYEIGNLGTMQSRIPYGLLLFSSFLIALFKHKQAHSALERYNKILITERKLNQEELVKALSHEARFFSEVTTAGASVLEAVSKKVEKFSQQVSAVTTLHNVDKVHDTLEEVNQALKNTMIYLRNVVYRVQGYIRLQVDNVYIKDLLTKTLTVLKAQNTSTQPHIRHITDATQSIQCDSAKIQQLLVNALAHAQQHNGTQQPVFLDIQETMLGYPIPSIKAYIKEVPALCITVSSSPVLPKPKKLYMGITGNNIFPMPQHMEYFPLLDNQRIIDAHYGAVEFIKDKETLIQVYAIPIHLREVRPSMMDLPQMEVNNLAEENKAVRPEETALLKRLLNETYVDTELAGKAIMYIKKHHGAMKRKSGEPFYLHPIAAADILLDYTEDQAAVLAALLHDTVEDTPLTLAEIGVVFGPDVAAIVNKVTHLDGQFRRVNMSTQENVRQLLEETDIRVLQVKLADRTHNMRTIEGHPSIAKRKKIAEETLHFFVPMAKHLDLKQIEEELQELVSVVMKKK